MTFIEALDCDSSASLARKSTSIPVEFDELILSHENRFIFLKTRKVAGSSIELYLRTLCGPDDIVTPLSREEESLAAELGARPPSAIRSRIRYPWEMHVEHWQQLKARRHWPKVSEWWAHMEASQVRRRVDKKSWDSYYRFSVIRNPWDRAVSSWYWTSRSRGVPLDWIIDHRSKQNWRIISIKNRLAVDDVIRFENLSEDFGRVCRTIGLPQPETLPRLKVGSRPPGTDYREVLTRKQADKITRMCKHEIELFGYDFDAG